MRNVTTGDQHPRRLRTAADGAPSCARHSPRSSILAPRSSLPGPRSSILTPRSLVALLLASLALPALAQDYPKLKPGLWEMERSSDRQSAQPNRMTMCLDDSVQREMFEMGAGAMKGLCSKHEFKLSGNRGTGDFVCDMGGSTMHSKSTMVLQGNSAYRTDIDTTYDPPFMGQAHTKTVIAARNLGPCKPGQRPGDMIMPNGQTMNMHDIMSGKGSIAPAPRAR
jgi:hypothetical protein